MRMTAGFGIERLGLVSLRYPRLSLLLVLAVSALFVAGSTQLSFNSDIREIFRSDSKDFVALERMTEQFPGSEHDVLVLVEGARLFRPARLEALRNLHLELRFVDGVRDVLSMFSARRVSSPDADPSLVFPNDLTAEENLDALKAEVQQHKLVRRKLLSTAADLALFVVTLDGTQPRLAEIQDVIDRVQQTSESTLEGTDLVTGLTGIPVMRVEIIGALKRDQLVFIAGGFCLAVLLSWLLLNRPRDILIVCGPAIVSTIALIGSLWLRGQEINVLTNGLPALVMVIAFADSLHLMFAVRGKLGAGQKLRPAIVGAIEEVGPACVLTSLTTAAALSTLAWVDNPLIAGFGASAALGTVIAFVATMLTFPPAAMLLLAREDVTPAKATYVPWVQSRIATVSRSIAALVTRRPRTVAVAGLSLFVVTAGLYWANEPHYIYREYLPSGNPVFAAMRKIDRKLAGTSTIRVHLQWSPDRELYTQENLDVIGEVHRIIAATPLIEETWSIETLASSLVEAGFQRGTIPDYLAGSRSPLLERMASPTDLAMLVTGQYVDRDSAILVPVLDSLEEQLGPLRTEHPDIEISLTGISPVAARMSFQMIAQLNLSLLTAIAIIIVLLGCALRSVTAAAASVLPNLMPIAAGGSFLYAMGAGLQFSSMVAFTLGFGLAADSTIHVLNRYRLCRDAAMTPAESLSATLTVVGPVLIVSTIVLAAGIGMTMLSEMPSIQLYGRLCVIVLSVSLVGALLFLPAILFCATPNRGPAGGE